VPKLDSLEPLMIEELRDLLDAERQITKALPRMAKAASSDELRAAFEEHLEITNEQIERLNQIFDELDHPAKPKKCAGMRGLIEEGKEKLDEDAVESVTDAALIAAAQKVEHYEIAAYGTVRTYAERLGHDHIAELLEQTLEEEKETDRKLTELAESLVNPEAAAGAEGMETFGGRSSGSGMQRRSARAGVSRRGSRKKR
jgi:ferritin-like metal-binding protein YciE